MDNKLQGKKILFKNKRFFLRFSHFCLFPRNLAKLLPLLSPGHNSLYYREKRVAGLLPPSCTLPPKNFSPPCEGGQGDVPSEWNRFNLNYPKHLKRKRFVIQVKTLRCLDPNASTFFYFASAYWKLAEVYPENRAFSPEPIKLSTSGVDCRRNRRVAGLLQPFTYCITNS